MTRRWFALGVLTMAVLIIGVDGTGAADGRNVQWSKACTIGGRAEQVTV